MGVLSSKICRVKINDIKYLNCTVKKRLAANCGEEMTNTFTVCTIQIQIDM